VERAFQVMLGTIERIHDAPATEQPMDTSLLARCCIPCAPHCGVGCCDDPPLALDVIIDPSYPRKRRLFRLLLAATTAVHFILFVLSIGVTESAKDFPHEDNPPPPCRGHDSQLAIGSVFVFVTLVLLCMNVCTALAWRKLHPRLLWLAKWSPVTSFLSCITLAMYCLISGVTCLTCALVLCVLVGGLFFVCGHH
jgi:hypothetical protein